jgi:hypothetical protein
MKGALYSFSAAWIVGELKHLLAMISGLRVPAPIET